MLSIDGKEEEVSYFFDNFSTPGPHTLKVEYYYRLSHLEYKGSPIVIKFNAKAGKIYFVRAKIGWAKTFPWNLSNWSAWVDEYP